MLKPFGPQLFFETGGGGGGSQPTPSTPPSPEPPPSPSQPAPGGGNMIPQDRFNEVTRQARDAQTRAERAEAALREREDAERSELDRAKTQAEREKARADAADAELAKTKRNYALRAAAQEAGAISPDAIVALAESRGVEIDVDKPESITAAIDAMKGTDEAPGPDAALFGTPGDAPPKPSPLGLPHTPTPTTPDPAEADDPKLALGKGIFAAMTGGRSQ